MTTEPKCPECSGETIEFQGGGTAIQYKVCTRWREPGHLSKEEVESKLADMRRLHAPRSGRFA